MLCRSMPRMPKRSNLFFAKGGVQSLDSKQRAVQCTEQRRCRRRQQARHLMESTCKFFENFDSRTEVIW